MRLGRLATAIVVVLALASSGQAAAKGAVDPVLDLATGHGSTWAVSGLDLVQVAGRSGEVLGRTRLGPAFPLAVAAGEGAVWVVGSYLGVRRRFAALWQVDPTNGRRVGRAIGMDAAPVGVAAAAGRVWVLDRARGRLLAFSASTRRLVQEIPVGRAPVALEAGAGAVWVTRAGLRRRPVRPGSVACTLLRVDPRRPLRSSARRGATQLRHHASTRARGRMLRPQGPYPPDRHDRACRRDRHYLIKPHERRVLGQHAERDTRPRTRSRG